MNGSGLHYECHLPDSYPVTFSFVHLPGDSWLLAISYYMFLLEDRTVSPFLYVFLRSLCFSHSLARVLTHTHAGA